MKRESCKRERLVESELCSLDLCQHGTVHVKLGALSFRIRPERLRPLAAALARGADVLEARLRRRQQRLS